MAYIVLLCRQESTHSLTQYVVGEAVSPETSYDSLRN